VNRSGNGHLTLRELKRGNLIAAMQHADEEEDINKVLRYGCWLAYAEPSCNLYKFVYSKLFICFNES